MTERVVLAYSGGLDTSVAISWIAEETGAEVVAVAIDLGQGGEDMEVIRQRALDCGAVEAVVVDARDEFADEYCLPALQANALYMDRYPLVSALSPAADRQAPRRRGARARRRRSSRTAAPARATTRSASRSASARWHRTCRCIAPVRDYAWTREKAIAFAEENAHPDRRHQAVAVLDRPERVGPRGGDRLPRGHLERADRGRLRLHRRTRPCPRDADEVVVGFERGRAGRDRRRAGDACSRRSRSSTGAPARRASAGSTWSRTGWSASRAARSTRRPARWR